MNEPGKLTLLSKIEPSPRSAPSEAPCAACSTSPEHIYDLRRGNRCSDGFYAEVSQFADRLLPEIERRAGPLLDGYSRHVQQFLAEPPRSRGEYAIELLTLGMALEVYEGAAQETSRWVVELA